MRLAHVLQTVFGDTQGPQFGGSETWKPAPWAAQAYDLDRVVDDPGPRSSGLSEFESFMPYPGQLLQGPEGWRGMLEMERPVYQSPAGYRLLPAL